ncbi:unnamed protein product [Darwinula stevensoni]|uniref:C2H2-type domain-containing protein n=1 Tax=Darwinula stevensoni TaxID=69355 RepID=A0A7R8X3G5_9CRUS|nr:unnamed protein product [Darwinula stevensoni]CAG0878612.1 unnamed protein product [Darwinula stevensoni]
MFPPYIEVMGGDTSVAWVPGHFTVQAIGDTKEEPQTSQHGSSPDLSILAIQSKTSYVSGDGASNNLVILTAPSSSSSTGSSEEAVSACPICNAPGYSFKALEQHMNNFHFALRGNECDKQNESGEGGQEFQGSMTCPICSVNLDSFDVLEEHVERAHVSILSPCHNTPGVSTASSLESLVTTCPICGMSAFESSKEMSEHVNAHFENNDQSEDQVLRDGYLAQELERREWESMKREREKKRRREETEFQALQEEYGMSQKKASDIYSQHLTRKVEQGQLSAVDYHVKMIQHRTSHSESITDDSSIMTRDLTGAVMKFSSQSPKVIKTWICNYADHFSAGLLDKGWGCGYRNLQMMLSSMKCSSAYAPLVFPQGETMYSIRRLQSLIEEAWKQGFDGQGAEQLGYKVQDTCKWIGATEVITFLSSRRIRCQLVDFHIPTGPNSTHPHLFEWVKNYYSCIRDYTLPLYFQYNGHSLTIVGVEQLRDGSTCLLVFNPSTSPQVMKRLKADKPSSVVAPSQMKALRKSLCDLTKDQYQIVAVFGTMSSREEFEVGLLAG